MRSSLLMLTFVVTAGLFVAGCKSRDQSDRQAGTFDGNGSYQDEAFNAKPKVTAETYFAAGMFHETSTTTNQNQLTEAQQERQIRQQQTLAVGQYERALNIDPNHQPTLFRMGVLLTEHKDFEEAEKYWARYVKATNGAARAWINLAICQEVAGEAEKAERSYRQAVSVEPTNKVARTNLGMLLAREGQLQEAAAQLSSVLEPAAVHWHLAHALAQRGQIDAANRHFRAAASIDPKYRRDGNGVTASVNPAE